MNTALMDRLAAEALAEVLDKLDNGWLLYSAASSEVVQSIRRDERKRIAGNVSLKETSPLLLTILRALGNEYGPAGVLGAAMRLIYDESLDH